MQTSLQAISVKAAKHKSHRFRNLFRLLTIDFLFWCFKLLNKKAVAGVDGVDARKFEKSLLANVKHLFAQVKHKRYRARLIRRQYIPKSNGKLRPLGILIVADKLLQMAVAKILEAIYEQDFLPCSYGYRPNLGPLDAVRLVNQKLQFGPFRYIVEADIQDFFGSILHHKLLEMLSLRIDDKPFLALIRKWLKAGVLEADGKVLHPATGTPQGAVVSPVLANVYLHHALDVWFHEQFLPQCKGMALLCRYADDFVCAFQLQEDAQFFFNSLGPHLALFGLKLAEDKTRIVRFSCSHQHLNSCFEFLGFQFSWGFTRKGKPQIFRHTSPKKFRNSVANFTSWAKENRNIKLRELFLTLNAKLRGYYNYYGVRGNFKRLSTFFSLAVRILFKWLNRRSQRKSFSWTIFQVILKYYKIATPRIVEKFAYNIR